MQESPTWYSDPEVLLDKLRNTRVHWGHVPRIDGYDQLVEERRGGQGVVYRARQCSTGRSVAIKVLLDGGDAEASRLRFEREAAVVAGLRHPNIVRMHDSGATADGRLYYVMEWVEGHRLDDPQLPHHGDLHATLQLIAKVCDAVQYAHQRGVIHRDLKPGNILIEPDGTPQVLDFGLAKLAGEDEPVSGSLSRTGQFLGSLSWASPEQVESAHDRVDTRSDVYALGVVLYQQLCGQLPFAPRSSLREMLDDISTASPTRPRALRPQIPLDVETIVLRCLAKEPERRYQGAGELAADIRRYLAGAPIDARRDNPVYVLRKTLARHRAVSSLAALLLLSVVVFAVTMTVYYRRALAAELQAKQSLAEALTQSRTADSLQSFFRTMLQSVQPDRSGRDVRVLDILDHASRRLQAGMPGQPEVEATLRATLGLSYRALGALAKADPHLAKAVELRRQVLGPEHRDTLVALNELAVLRIMQGRLDVAETLLEEALQSGRRQFGAADALVRYSLGSLAGLRNAQQRLPEAKALLRELLAAQEQSLGAKHPSCIRTIHNLGVVLAQLDELDEAVELSRRAVALHTEVHGEEHIHTLRAKGNLGDVLLRRADAAAAAPLLEAAAAGCATKLGPAHPDTINVRHNLAALRAAQGKSAEALALARDVLATAERALPAGHLRISRYRAHVGAMLLLNGERAAAESELLAAHEGLLAGFGADHAYTVEVVTDLVRLYEQQPEKARQWRARLPEAVRARRGGAVR